MDVELLLRRLNMLRNLTSAAHDLVEDTLAELNQIAAEQEQTEPRCSNCGSARLTDVSGMSGPEFRCADCDQVTDGKGPST